MKKGYNYDKLLKRKPNLDIRNSNLQLAKKILNKLKIKYWLYEGALLGIYREGNFIAWDWDLDLLVYTEEILPKFESVIKAFKKNGFKCNGKKNIKKKRPKIGLQKDGEKISINGYFLNKKKNLRVRVPYRFPTRFFKCNETIKFKGEVYPCPGPIEEYLEMAYGDWKVPIKSGNPDEYRRGRGKNSKKVNDRYKEAKSNGAYKKYDINKIDLQGYKPISGDK